MKKLSSKKHKSLNNKLNRPADQCYVRETSQKKAICIIASILPNIEKVGIPCLRNKIVLLMRRCSE